MRVERRILLSAMIALTLCLSALIGVLGASPSDGTVTYRESPTAAKTLDLTAHDPIEILGNGGFTNASGVVWGIGTESDPFIIEGWDIIASSADGIRIYRSDAYFIIRNCYIHDSGQAGIALYLCENGTLINNTCSNNGYGIHLQGTTTQYGIQFSSRNSLINNTCSNNEWSGISIGQSSRTSLINNTCSNNGYGISLDWCVNCTLRGNSLVDDGIRVRGASSTDYDTHSIDTTNTVNGKPVYYYCNETGITVPSGAGQILMAYCTDMRIQDQNLSDVEECIQLGFCTRVTATCNNCSNSFNGISLLNSSNNNLNNNTCSDNHNFGMYLMWSSNNTLSDNTWSDNECGIFLQCSANNSLNNNICSNNGDGIYLHSSSGNTLTDNTMINDGISMEGDSLSYWNTHSIDTSNTVNGKPVYYLKDQNGTTVPPGAGEVIMANCTNILLENQNLSNSGCGIEIIFSSNILIVNNTCNSNNYYGIWLQSSSGNTLSNNTCNSNTWAGIALYSSGGNTLSDNNCSSNNWAGIWLFSSSGNALGNNNYQNNGYGIILDGSSDDNTLSDNNCSSNNWAGISLQSLGKNTLIHNNCSNGHIGVELYSSSNNTLSCNNFSNNSEYGLALYSSNGNNIIWNQIRDNHGYGVFISSGSNNNIWNNTLIHNNGASDTYDTAHIQAGDDGTDNWWNSTDGYGNYWSDWTGPDLNMDEIVDSPYVVSGTVADNYPRTALPSEPIPEFGMMPFVVMALMAAIVLTTGAMRRMAH